MTGVGRSLGAAVTGNRSLEVFEATPLLVVGALLVALAIVAFIKPTLLAWPLGVIAVWAGITFVAEGWTIWRRRVRR